MAKSRTKNASFRYISAMIKPNELRLGNWVIMDDKNNAGHGRPGRVTSIDSEHANLTFVNFCDYPSLNAIEITHEILEGCGFVATPDTINNKRIYHVPHFPNGRLYGHPNVSEMFILGIHHFGNEVFHVCEFRFLHELQNAYFVLCRQELDISLQ